MAFGINEKKALLTRNSIAFQATDKAAEINQLILDEIGTMEDAERQHNEWEATQNGSATPPSNSVFAAVLAARELRAQGADKIVKEPYNATKHGPANLLKNGMDDVKYPYRVSFGEVQKCEEFKSSRGNTLYNFTIEVDGSLAYATGQKALEEGTFVKFQSKQLPGGKYAEIDKNGTEMALIVPAGRILYYQSLIGVKKATRESIETSILIKQNKELLAEL